MLIKFGTVVTDRVCPLGMYLKRFIKAVATAPEKTPTDYSLILKSLNIDGQIVFSKW